VAKKSSTQSDGSRGFQTAYRKKTGHRTKKIPQTSKRKAHRTREVNQRDWSTDWLKKKGATRKYVFAVNLGCRAGGGFEKGPSVQVLVREVREQRAGWQRGQRLFVRGGSRLSRTQSKGEERPEGSRFKERIGKRRNGLGGNC